MQGIYIIILNDGLNCGWEPGWVPSPLIIGNQKILTMNLKITFKFCSHNAKCKACGMKRPQGSNGYKKQALEMLNFLPPSLIVF